MAPVKIPAIGATPRLVADNHWLTHLGFQLCDDVECSQRAAADEDGVCVWPVQSSRELADVLWINQVDIRVGANVEALKIQDAETMGPEEVQHVRVDFVGIRCSVKAGHAAARTTGKWLTRAGWSSVTGDIGAHGFPRRRQSTVSRYRCPARIRQPNAEALKRSFVAVMRCRAQAAIAATGRSPLTCARLSRRRSLGSSASRRCMVQRLSQMTMSPRRQR